MVAGIVSTREADIALELFAHRDKYDEETVGRIGKLATVLRSWFGESCVDTSVSPYRLEFTFPSPSPDESVVYEIEAYFVAILEGMICLMRGEMIHNDNLLYLGYMKIVH